MRLPTLFSALVALTTFTFAEQIFLHNNTPDPIWYTTVDQTGYRSDTVMLAAFSKTSLDQSSNPGVAIKITPGQADIDTAGKGVLTLGYTKTPDGWIYYDLGVHEYFPFPGVPTNLGGPGGANDWNDGKAHAQETVGFHGSGDLYLDIGK
jgi:hypothetical protein